MVGAKINGCVGNILFDTGAQISLISENFVNKHKYQFKEKQILPVSNTIVTTATGDSQIVLGTDTLKKIHATIDVSSKTLTCIIQNKLHNISLGHKQNNINECERNVNLQQPAGYRIDKIMSNGQCTGDKQTACQEKQLINSLNKCKSFLKILAVKYTLPDDLKNRLKLVNLEQQKDAKVRKIREEIQRQDDPKYRIDRDVLYKIIDGQWKIMVKCCIK